jgi:hypothetical protein
MQRTVIFVAVLLAAAATAPAYATAGPTQLLAALRSGAQLYSSPDLSTPQRVSVPAHRPLTGERTVLPVLQAMRGGDGTRFLRVLLPGRPNGHAAWIRERGVTLTRTPWHVVIRTAAARVLVLRRGRIIRSFRAVVGASSTRTPPGRFFVEEVLRLRSGTPGWPFAFALSARSEVYREFEGGPGQIAIHGTAGIGGVLGTAASHGCIRLDVAALTWLARHIGNGTPVSVRS